MKKQHLPKTDSIQELAQFWDEHDLTDFEDELEEVTDPVFAPATVIPLSLESDEAEAERRIAEARGIADAELIRVWVRERYRPVTSKFRLNPRFYEELHRRLHDIRNTYNKLFASGGSSHQSEGRVS